MTLSLALPQGVVVGEADDAGGVESGDGGVPVVDEEVPLPGQLFRRIKPGGVQLAVKVHLLHIPVLILNGDVEGGLVLSQGVQGGVKADGAGSDAHGQQQQDTDDGLGQVGGVDLAHPLPQGEEVQVFIVETGVALGQPQHKAGQRPENEQGTYRTQGQHGHTEHGHGQNHHAEGEQHDIGHPQAHYPQHTLEHRPR